MSATTRKFCELYITHTQLIQHHCVPFAGAAQRAFSFRFCFAKSLMISRNIMYLHVANLLFCNMRCSYYYWDDDGVSGLLFGCKAILFVCVAEEEVILLSHFFATG